MIKANSFLRKSFQAVFILFSDLQLLTDTYLDMNVSRFKCHHCGQTGDFSASSSYSRTLITVENNKRVEYQISIQRIRCSCGHCHAIIPDFLVPYGSYTIRFILHVLRAYLHRTSSVSSFCEHWQISVSTLYDWIHRFRDQFNLWSGIMASISWVSDQSIELICRYPDFASAFLSLAVVFSFLQNYPTFYCPSG